MDQARLDQITEAATLLFSRQGYHATTMRQVARAVDLQGGSLYSHIESKEDVLAAIVDRAARDFQAALAPVMASGAPAPERLRWAVRAHVGVIAGNRAAATVFLQDWRHLSPERQDEVRRQRDRYEALWRELIATGVAEGSFRVQDVRLAAIACLSLCNWTYQWFRPADPLGADALAEAFSDILLGGLRPAPTPTEASPA